MDRPSEQLSWLDDPVPTGPAARRTDPETSKAAARSMPEAAARQRAQILALLAQFPAGLTHREIDDQLGWDHPTAARRMKELRDVAAVRIDGIRPMDTGRSGSVYVLPQQRGQKP